jgi:2-keto-4-pentenoate hydratase/2-oxohepta-3-ene-1,7-dioic acid hydratase in catechol pathway
MKIASFTYEARASWGKLEPDCIIPVVESARIRFPTLGAALRQGYLYPEEFAFGEPLSLSKKGLLLCAPIGDPGKIIGIGRNYRGHVAEMRSEMPKFPSLFLRMEDTLVAPDSPLICPRVSSQFDYEGEIAIIIGKGGRHIEMDQAADHIFGYSLFNDASVRDFQQGHSLAAGKNFHRTGAFGPSILLAAAVRDARSLSFTTSVNGERRQSASLSDLLFDLNYLISYISRITPLLPGNVILTGTPQGVGFSRVPPIWLKPGDIIEVASPDIGTLRNSVVAEAV